MTIENKLTALTQAYLLLTDANQKYIASSSRANVESFRNLIDQRAIISEDIELLSRELVNETEQGFRGNTFNCQNVAEIIRALSIIAPDLSNACQELKDALKNLVATDKQVEEVIAKMCDELKVEISKIRKGSQGIKGYRQTEAIGSCFINKVK